MRRLPLRPSVVLLGALSLTATLGGCATAADTSGGTSGGSSSGNTGGDGTAESSTAESAPSTPTASPSADAGDTASTSAYADGDYSATGDYQSPAGPESIDVSVTLEGDVVTAVTVEPQAESSNALRYQTAFAGNIADEVVGVAIDDLEVDKVAGSSLTSDGFNAAIEQIKGDAAA